MSRAKLLFSISVLAVLAMSTPAAAQWTQQSDILPDPEKVKDFGEWVDVSGNVGIVGAYGYDDFTYSYALLFDMTTGLPLPTTNGNNGKLVVDDSITSDRSPCAIGGNLAVITPFWANGDTNRAFLFDVSTGDQVAVIQEPAAVPGVFGASLDISGDILVIGAGFGTGALYVYDVSTPSAPALKGGGPITRSDEAVSGFTGDIGFGKYGLAISGTTVIVGASGADPDGKSNAGAAYMFDLSPLFETTPGAAVETKLLASDGLGGDSFGHSVDIDGDIAIVGAVNVDDEADPETITSVGAAYLFDTAGDELAELASDVPGYRYNFGHSVGISGDTAVVGEWTRYSGDQGHTAVPASVQLFDVSDPGTPTPIQKITSPNASHDYYAEHLAIDGNAILVGAKRADRTPTAARSGAYLIIGSLTWDGGTGSWADSNWSGGSAVAAEKDMVINADTADSDVTVATDFTTISTTGPAASVFVGETNAAKLTVANAVTLEVTGVSTAGEFGKIMVENGGTLDTGSAVIEIDGRLIAGVQGSTGDSGLVDSAGQMSIDEAEAIQMEWLPLPPDPVTPEVAAASMFGGVYRVAEYVGAALTTTGTTANADANIGTGYIKSVTYDVDVNGDGSLWAIDVELQPQGLGDTDLDADVDGDDLATFGLAWSPSGTDKTWFDGDFDFDGDIDGDDLAALGLAWAPGGITFPAGDIEVTTIPEPGTIVMLLLAGAGLLIYRKRR